VRVGCETMPAQRFRTACAAQWIASLALVVGLYGRLAGLQLVIRPSYLGRPLLRAQSSVRLAARRRKEEAPLSPKEEKLWRSVLDEPEKWKDGRELKRRGRLPLTIPDFLNKETGRGLFLESAPPWFPMKAGPSPEVLLKRKAKKNIHKVHWKLLFEKPEMWLDYRKMKIRGEAPIRHPDFKHKENDDPLWLSMAPETVNARFELGLEPKWEEASVFYKEVGAAASLWSSLLDQPEAWIDYRDLKAVGDVPSQYPDFKHRESSESLWLNGAPSDVSERIALGRVPKWPTPPGRAGIYAAQQPLWSSLFGEPDKWMDYRALKAGGEISPNFPDFKHRETRDGLWRDSAPAALAAKLASGHVPAWKVARSKDERFKAARPLWTSLLEQPYDWYDYRKLKSSGNVSAKFPDFKSRKGGQGLWLDGAADEVTARFAKGRVPTWQEAPSWEERAKSALPLWKSLFEKHEKWQDYRSQKQARLISEKHPDFRCKESGTGLWLNSAPEFVTAKIAAKQTPPWKEGRSPALKKLAAVPLWNSLLNQPDMWLDCRGLKAEGVVSANYPDFKQQDTESGSESGAESGALWLNEAPVEMKAKLSGKLPKWPAAPSPAEKAEATRPLWASLFNEPCMWLDYRQLKTFGDVSIRHPDFKHRDSAEPLWLGTIPEDLAESIAAGKMPSVPAAPTRAEIMETFRPLWNSLLTQPREWLDCRRRKAAGNVSPKYPDFKQKSTGEGLWLNSALAEFSEKIHAKGAPTWALEPMTQTSDRSEEEEEELWMSLFEEPENWADYRLNKTEGSVKSKYPDFKHKVSKEALWLGSSNPLWVAERLAAEPGPLEVSPSPDEEDQKSLWRSLFEQPELWEDCRPDKEIGIRSSTYPDFKQWPDDGRGALWVDAMDTPEWVLLRLAEGSFEGPS